MGRPAKKPTAADRTISLFTGMTDLDDPLRARDGQLPAEMPPPGPKLLKWEGGVTRWWVKDGPRGESYVIEKNREGRYTASWFSTRFGMFDTITQAGDACLEHHLARHR
jgi:hypothetical protein